MRKVSAHYYLRPDGTFGKRPIISMDDDGRIIHIREMGDDFKEEPSLEYFPGILVPGFVATINENNHSEIKKLQALSIANGVLRLKRDQQGLSSEEYIKAWSSIVISSIEAEDSLVNSLRKYTVIAAQLVNEPEWGVIRDGAKPGLLILKNCDLRNFTLTATSTFRIIQK